MDHNIALKKVLALSALAYAVQAQNYLPYIDGQCTKPVNNFNINGNVDDVTSSFSLEGFPTQLVFQTPDLGAQRYRTDLAMMSSGKFHLRTSDVDKHS